MNRYWKMVVVLAFKEALGAVVEHWRPALIASFATFAGLFGVFQYGSPGAGRDDLISVLWGLLAVAIVFLLVFLYKLASIPPRLHWRQASELSDRKASATPLTDNFARKRAAKALLGSYLMDGKALMRKVNVEKTAILEDWGTRTRNLIEEAFDPGEAALFLDSSGYTFYGDGSLKSKNRNWLDGRLRRLANLLQRCEQLPVSQDFDPAKWER